MKRKAYSPIFGQRRRRLVATFVHKEEPDLQMLASVLVEIAKQQLQEENKKHAN